MPSRRVRHAGGYLRDESPDRSRGRQDVELGIAGVFGDRLPEYRTAAAAIQQHQLPEVGALGRPADGAAGTAERREVQEHDGVRGVQPDIDDIVLLVLRLFLPAAPRERTSARR